jgi:hypothetical protein
VSLNAQSVDESLDAGFAALQKGDADRAATAFRRALGVQPETSGGALRRGSRRAPAGTRHRRDLVPQASLQSEPRLAPASALLGDIAISRAT